MGYRYSKEKILKDSLKIIEDKKPSDIEKLIFLLRCSSQTFYRYIRPGSNEMLKILAEIEYQNAVITTKAQDLLLKMENNPTALIATIRMRGTDKDRMSLSQNINVNANTTVNYEDVKKLEVNINKLTIEEQRMLNALLDKIKDE